MMAVVVVGGFAAKSCLTLANLWTVARQALLSLGIPRQGCWSGLPFPSPGDLPDPGIEPASPALAGGSLLLSHQGGCRGNMLQCYKGHTW